MVLVLLIKIPTFYEIYYILLWRGGFYDKSYQSYVKYIGSKPKNLMLPGAGRTASCPARPGIPNFLGTVFQ